VESAPDTVNAADEIEKAKRRIERDAERAVETRVRRVLGDFVEVLDDLDRAAAAAAGEPSILHGIELVRERFLGKLAGYGVRRDDDAGDVFDPERHEAVAIVAAPTPDRVGRVQRVLRPGYLVGDDVLRPASVIVSK
jgi:molecular chaperone GrpE